MPAVVESFLRQQLQNRRQRLMTAAGELRGSSEIPTLLKEVDSALRRMDEGTYGLCERCHDPIEQDRLMADPLLEYCLDHLDPTQQRALEQDLLSGRTDSERPPSQAAAWLSRLGSLLSLRTAGTGQR